MGSVDESAWILEVTVPNLLGDADIILDIMLKFYANRHQINRQSITRWFAITLL